MKIFRFLRIAFGTFGREFSYDFQFLKLKPQVSVAGRVILSNFFHFLNYFIKADFLSQISFFTYRYAIIIYLFIYLK